MLQSRAPLHKRINVKNNLAAVSLCRVRSKAHAAAVRARRSRGNHRPGNCSRGCSELMIQDRFLSSCCCAYAAPTLRWFACSALNAPSGFREPTSARHRALCRHIGRQLDLARNAACSGECRSRRTRSPLELAARPSRPAAPFGGKCCRQQRAPLTSVTSLAFDDLHAGSMMRAHCVCGCAHALIDAQVLLTHRMFAEWHSSSC